MPAPTLDPASIVAALPASARDSIGPVEMVTTTDSTNDILYTTPDDTPARTLLAQRQHAGRGRQGRHWTTTDGALCFSVLHTFPKPPPALTLWVGIALTRRLRAMGLGQPALSWPNDLVYACGKFGGILTECQTRANQTRCALGVGINVTTAPALSRPTTSITAACGKTPDLNTLAAGLLAALAECLKALDAGRKDGLVAHFAQHDSLKDQMVEVIAPPNRTYAGRACGVDAQGRLRVEGDAGMRHFDSADVRLRQP